MGAKVFRVRGGRIGDAVKLSLLLIQTVLVAPATALPWQLIAEQVRKGRKFFVNRDLSDGRKFPGVSDASVSPDALNFACGPNAAISVELPAGAMSTGSPQTVKAGLAMWTGTSWQDLGEVSATAGPGRVEIVDGIKDVGFFRVRFASSDTTGGLSSFEAYVVSCTEWRADILVFCRRMKEAVEYNRDPNLIFSSIAISHFDHTMEIISRESLLSGKVLGALANALESKAIFEAGGCPDPVIGLNKIQLKRFEGATIGEFAVFVPECYDRTKKWPVLLTVDARRREAKLNYPQRSGLIDVWWHFSGYQGFEWKDYEYFLSTLKRKLNVDEDRMYIYGLCGNGISAMALALNYPDQWAEFVSVLGSSYRHLAGNSRNLPSIYIQGLHDEDADRLASYKFVANFFLYAGIRNFKYSSKQELEQKVIEELRGKPLPEAIREKRPQRVSYSIDSLGRQKAYWVTILGREDENFVGSIDAAVKRQTVLVKTNNVNAYCLDLGQAPVDSNRPVEIVENGKSLGHVEGKVFTRRPEAYTNATCVKNDRLRGPLWDVFSEPYVVVYGTAGSDKESNRTSESLAWTLSRGAPCFSDTDLPEELIQSHHLVLVGTPQSNRWLSKICKDLPVQVEGNLTVADGKRFEGPDVGYMLIYPNPLRPEKYTAAFCAASSRAMAKMSQVYSRLKSVKPVDVCIFEIDGTGAVKLHIAERFSSVWGWHEQWNAALTASTKKHAKWRWGQWVAKALREQLGSDVAVCRDPLSFDNSIPVGQITCRDVFNNFRNDWVVKIRVDGRNLKKMLLKKFRDGAKNEADTLILDGMAFVRQPGAQTKNRSMDELENDKQYTVACPESVISGKGVGTVLEDYQIVGECYLALILKDYLLKNANLDIDAELESIKLNIF